MLILHSFAISKNISTFFQKTLDKSVPLCYNIVVPLMNVCNNCWCGSMAEHLICNQAVDGSTPFTSSILGGFPERPKGADCKSVVTDFGGPNPPSPTKQKALQKQCFFVPRGRVARDCRHKYQTASHFRSAGSSCRRAE